MPTVLATRALDAVKMDDRKRHASDEQDTPRTKRQAIAVNGTPTRAEDIPRDDDLERFTKDAILRQMKEYKREKHTLESQLAQVNSKSVFHDEHLRVIDAWLLQFIDEIALFHNKYMPDEPSVSPGFEFSTSLLQADSTQFAAHLGRKAEAIKEAIGRILQHTSGAADENKLRSQLAEALAAVKLHSTQIKLFESEKAVQDERLFAATNRYMTAEKQLDRVKSAQVAKLEAQAIATTKSDTKEKIKAETDKPEQQEDELVSGQVTEAAKARFDASSQKFKEQIENLHAENKYLSNQLTSVQVKLATLNEEDFANTELFKQVRTQYTENVKRLNDLEAKNAELLEEASLLQGQKIAYRDKLDNEFRDQDVAMQSEIAQKDADLMRIRGQRDEAFADLAVKKSTADTHKESNEKLKDLAEARQIRISVLESEVERLSKTWTAQESDDQPVDLDGLKTKVSQLQTERSALEQELKSMEMAWRKAQALASSKVDNLVHQEQRLRQSLEEKAKADQKYFGARKLLDAKDQQFRDMQKQVAKSSEIISTLKDSEAGCRALLANIEKQLAEANNSLQVTTSLYHTAQQAVAEQKAATGTLTNQTEELRKLLVEKDEQVSAAKKAQRDAEIATVDLKVTAGQNAHDLESWKQKALGSQSEDYLSMKKLCWCAVCDKNIKDTVLKTCKHVMCKECVGNRLALRQRRCPICNMAFGANDTMEITL